MSVRRRAVKERVERDRKLQDGMRKLKFELNLLQRVVDDARMDGLTHMSEAELARRL